MQKQVSKNIVVVGGLGIVGKIEYETLYKKFLPDIIDLEYSIIDGQPYKFETALDIAKNIVYDLAIVAVPTPLDATNHLDCHLVYDAVAEVNAKVYLIKSTTNIGYCDYLALQTGKHIVHSPEFAGDTQHCNNFEYNFTILGGDVQDCQFIQEIYQEVFDARHEFIYLNRAESEYSKFLENSWLASQTSFWNHAYEGTLKFDNICFEKVREATLHDPRIARAHSAVYRGHPFFVSKCFDKDIPAYVTQTDNKFMADVLKNNEYLKQKYKKD